MGDGEVASTAESISKSADQLKKALDNDLKKDTTIDKATRQAIVDGAGQMSKDAKTLRDRVKSGNPSSAEAARIFDHASRIQSFLDSHRAPTASGIWNGVAPKLSPLAGAYGLSWPAR
jgi:hypothetical protein